jgi:hypothetical protein
MTEEDEMTTTAPESAEAPAGTRRSRLTIAVPVLLVLALVALGVYVWHARTATPSAPYADPAAAGRLTICSAGGAEVTKGSLDEPLGAFVVGGVAAVGGYADTGRQAALFAYQPRPGVDAAEWSGVVLNAPGTYPDPARPRAATGSDSITIGQFVKGYPALDKGWVQLRLVLSAPGQPEQSTSYAAGDLHVHGSTWTLADPGTGGCS